MYVLCVNVRGAMGWENVKTMLVVCVLLVACFSINMVNADSDDSAEHRALRDDSMYIQYHAVIFQSFIIFSE